MSPRRKCLSLALLALAALAAVIVQEQSWRDFREGLGIVRRIPRDEQEIARLGGEALRAGRLDEAEMILRPASEAGIFRSAPRALYEQMLLLEGRRDEYRAMLAEDVARLEDPLPPLRELWRDDAGPFAFDRTRAALEALGASSPDDARLWLARANLALRSGRLDEAAEWLARCWPRRGDDPGYGRTAIALAVARDDRDLFVRTIRENPIGRSLDRADTLALHAWLARLDDDHDRERRALTQLVAADPGRVAAIERLANLAAVAGNADELASWRARKAAIDRAREPYRQGIESPDAASRAEELANLAETLGRLDEAKGWWRLELSRNPGNDRARDFFTRIELNTVAADLVDFPAFSPSASLADRPSPPRGLGTGPTPVFDDDTERAGIAFTYQSGKTVVHQLPETMGGGVGLIDHDGDGFLDVYLVQGGAFPPDPKQPPRGDRLYRNKGDGTFEDATKRAGIAGFRQGYGHGVAVGDIDNDGHADLFLTRWRGYALYRNKGDGTFEDATARWGLEGDRDWPTSAALADLDGDGDLDLYVCHYLAWDEADPRLCRNPETSAYAYCAPLVLPARADHLFRNDGGRFTDVSDEAGITAADQDGRGLGVVAADLDGDGRLDLYVANDASANFLFRNLGGMRFEEVGHASGVAGNADGGYQGSMGVACGDLDGDGLPDLAVTNLYGESTTFYRNLGGGAFADQTAAVGLATASRELLGFGAGFLDANNDGLLDLATANGHVNDYRPSYPYPMSAQLLVGVGGGKLRDATEKAGPVWTTPRVGRALALGDLDHDHRVDGVLVPLDTPTVVLRNRTEGGRALTLRLEGTPPGSNRDAVGAVVTVRAGGLVQTFFRIGGGSYQSAQDARLHVGLGPAEKADVVEVRWPSGASSTYKDLPAGRGHHLLEGRETPAPLAGFPPR